ncbi:TetR/AcrR family transcriptional regulator [Candidatus Riflebacteria bacterium]
MPRNRELSRQMRDERREQILSTALKLFATRGLVATKIKDIASEAGIAQGLFYHYYRSKEEIFVELLKNAFEKMKIAALALEKLPMSPLQKIRTALEKMLQSLEENEDFSRSFLFITQAAVSEAIPSEAKDIIRSKSYAHYEVIDRIIIAGQKEGSIKNFNSRDLTLVFWTSLNGLAINKAIRGTEFRVPDCDILMQLFAADNN